MKYYILAILLLYTIPAYNNRPFYYRDSLGNLRIYKDFPREVNGNLIVNIDSVSVILSNDSSLSSIERLNLADSIFPSNQTIINNSKEIGEVGKNQRQEKENFPRILRLIAACIVGACIIFLFYKKRKNK